MWNFCSPIHGCGQTRVRWSILMKSLSINDSSQNWYRMYYWVWIKFAWNEQFQSWIFPFFQSENTSFDSFCIHLNGTKHTVILRWKVISYSWQFFWIWSKLKHVFIKALHFDANKSHNKSCRFCSFEKLMCFQLV